MAPHQERVVNERNELSEKLDKLVAFFDSSIFQSLDFAERGRLHLQRHAMEIYLGILTQRIAAF